MSFYADLITRDSVEVLVQEYNRAWTDIDAGFDLLQAGQERLEEAFGSKYQHFHPLDTYPDIPGLKKKARVKLRRSAWTVIFERLQFRKILSLAREKELNEKLEKGNLPDISEESVQEMIATVAQSLQTMARESIQEAFGFLRPYRSKHKTNKRWKVPAKVILTDHVEPNLFGKSTFRVSYYYQQQLIVLDRAMALLDGHLMDKSGSYRSPLVDAIQTAEDGRGSTDYYEFKCYKNGNLHLKFLRPDLVEALNRFGGEDNALGTGERIHF